MAQREWVEKDFYKELGVSSDASAKEIKRADRKLARRDASRHATRSSGRRAVQGRVRGHRRAVRRGQAQGIRRNPTAFRQRRIRPRPLQRRRWRQLRRIRRRRRRVQPERPVRRGRAKPVAPTSATCSAGCSAAAHSSRGPAGRDAATTWRPRPSCRFLEATKGVAMPLRLTSPAPCTNCHGSGARPGTSPKVCPNCNGAGVINRNQGAFGFSEPCTECRGSGSIIEHPCDECKGTGRHHPHPHHQRADPAGRRGRSADPAGRPGRGRSARRAVGRPVRDRTCQAGQGVRPRRRRPDRHGSRQLPANWPWAQRFRCRRWKARSACGCPRARRTAASCGCAAAGCRSARGGHGDLLVTVKVAVPPNLEGEAAEALEAYAKAERASGFDPRAGWAGA